MLQSSPPAITLAGYTPTQKHAQKPLPRKKKHHRGKSLNEIVFQKLKLPQKQRKPLYSTRISRICNLTPQSYATTPWWGSYITPLTSMDRSARKRSPHL